MTRCKLKLKASLYLYVQSPSYLALLLAFLRKLMNGVPVASLQQLSIKHLHLSVDSKFASTAGTVSISGSSRKLLRIITSVAVKSGLIGPPQGTLWEVNRRRRDSWIQSIYVRLPECNPRLHCSKNTIMSLITQRALEVSHLTFIEPSTRCSAPSAPALWLGNPRFPLRQALDTNRRSLLWLFFVLRFCGICVDMQGFPIPAPNP